MKLHYVKIHPDRYRLECLRKDGSATSAELEMRGFLKHDLMHFVVESRAQLSDSFYGPIARGMNLEELSSKAMKEKGPPSPSQGEGQSTEIIVSTLQGITGEDEDMEERVKKVSEYLTLLGVATPGYFTKVFCAEAVAEHHVLMKRWNDLQIGSAIELDWKE